MVFECDSVCDSQSPTDRLPPRPPYENEDAFYADAPRKAERQIRKNRGLPASEDVGILSKIVGQLRSTTESDLGIEICSASIITPRLVGLYQDDVRDALEHAGLEYVEAPRYRLLRSGSALPKRVVDGRMAGEMVRRTTQLRGQSI